jgi:hypothetical protein
MAQTAHEQVYSGFHCIKNKRENVVKQMEIAGESILYHAMTIKQMTKTILIMCNSSYNIMLYVFIEWHKQKCVCHVIIDLKSPPIVCSRAHVLFTLFVIFLRIVVSNTYCVKT